MRRRHRFFGNFSFDSQRIRITDISLIHQLKNVLRLEIGEEVVLCDGKNGEATVTLTGLEKGGADFEIVKVQKNKNESSRHLTLYGAILKRENFEWVAQKATEIGVTKIVPIQTAHTVKLSLSKERIQKIMKEAAEQSGRGIIPILEDILDFYPAVERAAKEHEMNFLCDARGKELNSNINAKNIGLFIGPEGGWSEEEIKSVKKSKFQIMSLGKLMFRAETAAIVSAYQVLYI